MPDTIPETFAYKSKKTGKTYYLHSRLTYYFAVAIDDKCACEELPDDKVIVENKKNGFPMVGTKK